MPGSDGAGFAETYRPNGAFRKSYRQTRGGAFAQLPCRPGRAALVRSVHNHLHPGAEPV